MTNQVAVVKHESYDVRKSAFQRLRVTLHLRLPPEILLEIFLILANDDISIPPVLTQIPWVLGRVCSRWRSITRSDARLWGCPQVEWTSKPPVHKIERAFNVLPPVVRLSLRIRQEPDFNSHNNLKFLIPYIHRCKVLDLSACMNSFDDFWLTPMPHNAFANLYQLSLHIDDITRPGERIISGTNWGDMAGLLRMASQLRSLSISSNWSWSPVLLSMGIPWNQLTHLYVQGVSDIPALYKVLRQCSSLVRLYLVTLSAYKSVPKFSNDLHLDHLLDLHVSGYSRPSWIPQLHNWECLTDLTLSHPYHADDLQDMLHKCVNLAHLSFHPPGDFPLEPLPLPSIRTIRMKNSSYGGLPFSRLVLPSLEELYIFDRARLDLIGVCDMLENSQCPLSYFFFNALSSSVIPRDFLLSISSVTSQSITALFPLGKFSAHVLNDIGLGILLPKFDKLVCIPDSVEAMLDMLEARINWQVQHWTPGPKTLHISTGYKNVSAIEAERLNNLHLRVPTHIDMKILVDLNYEFTYKWSITFQTLAE
ncbi:hypothetical protein C0993_005240 [Termitomyces sp. T159_Od127]|nr:hypothetical protein C0993_005240 [Termitomyces sp. T159_Od127]